MKRSFLGVAVLLIIFASVAFAQSNRFLAFRDEVSALEKAVGCKGKTSPPEAGMGALFSCIQGKAQTAKLFVNEKAGTDQVQNAKVMWNDWFKDVGYGVHADKAEAKRIVQSVLSRYAPEKKDEIEKSFFENKDKTFTVRNFTVNFTYHHGPAIDERMLTITQK